MELRLLNLLILIDCSLCSSYPCLLFESFSHVINHESHVYSWNLGKIYHVHFLKLWNLLCFTQKNSKFQKSELGKFIPKFFLKHMISSTNRMAKWNLLEFVSSVILQFLAVSIFPAADLWLPAHSKNIRMLTIITMIITY